LKALDLKVPLSILNRSAYPQSVGVSIYPPTPDKRIVTASKTLRGKGTNFDEFNDIIFCLQIPLYTAEWSNENS